METEPCSTCQCVVTPEDVDRELGAGYLVPPENLLGTVQGTDEEVTIETNGTYIEENVTITVARCVEW